MRSNFGASTLLLLAPALCPAARLSEPAERAFATYVATVETRLAAQKPLGGGVRVEPVNGGTWHVTGGLLHYWRAAALVRGASPRDMLALLRDYDHLAQYYAPEVVSSRALSDHGNRATLAMRFRKQRVITVVLDAEFENRSGLSGAGRGYSFSRSMHIWQVEHAGSPDERRRPEGDDDGFLWRLNSYWTFEQTSEGLRIECETVSLTRDIPAGLGWLVTPIIETLPRDSLEFTMTATRNALVKAANRRPENDRAN